MKKSILLSLVAATVLFTACGEKTDKTQEEAQAKAERTVELAKMEADKVASEAKEKVEVAQAKAAEMAENTKVEAEKAAAVAAEKSVEATEAVTEATADAVESVKEASSEAVEAVTGEAAYAKCAACHGKDGKTQALGKSAVIAGQAAAVLETSLAEYKAGTRNVVGMGMLMKSQVATMSDEEIKAVAEYISKM